MARMKLRNHMGSWVIFMVFLAYETLQFFPGRIKFFTRLPLVGHSPYLASFYVLIVPFIEGVLYVFSCQWSWKFKEGNKWSCPTFFTRGFAIQFLLIVTLLGLDRFGFYYLYNGNQANEPFLMDLIETLATLQVAGFLSVALNGLNESRHRLRRCAKMAQMALDEARGRLVVAQLDPHVIFNVLASAEALTHDPTVYNLLEAMSGYLQRVLEATKAPLIALEEERAIVRDFLAIEAIQVGERLKVEWDWTAEEVMVPPLILQTLVENAFKHGVFPCVLGGTIRVCAQEEGGRLRLAVENTGKPLLRTAGGTGLENLRDRVQNAYAGAGSFKIEAHGGWTIAELTIPMEPVCAS